VDVEERVEREARRAARGRDADTPVVVHNMVFLAVAALVILVLGIAFAVYYLVR
jgi:hypothetical protein